MICAVRGAIVVPANERGRIWDAAVRLVAAMRDGNSLAEKDIVSIVFSVTADLNAGNPAEGLRRRGYASTPLFCVQEADVEGGMARVLRALLTADMPGLQDRAGVVHAYLDGARALRPDLADSGQ
jgi:chorismate mutase